MAVMERGEEGEGGEVIKLRLKQSMDVWMVKMSSPGGCRWFGFWHRDRNTRLKILK